VAGGCHRPCRSLHLGEGLDDLKAFLIGEALDRGLLRFEAQAGPALLAGRNADVGDCGFHARFLSVVTGQGTSRLVTDLVQGARVVSPGFFLPR
jgi:hypothetical protein